MTAHVRALPDFRSLDLAAGGRDSIQVIGGDPLRGVRLRNYTAGKVYWGRNGLEFGYVPADYMHPINFASPVWELALRAEAAGQVTVELAADAFIGESPQELGTAEVLLPTLTAIHADVAKEATLATRSAEATAAKEATLATRATDAELAAMRGGTSLETLRSQVAKEATLATRAAEATLATRASDLILDDARDKLADVVAEVTGVAKDASLGDLATEATLDSRAAEATLEKIYAESAAVLSASANFPDDSEIVVAAADERILVYSAVCLLSKTATGGATGTASAVMTISATGFTETRKMPVTNNSAAWQELHAINFGGSPQLFPAGVDVTFDWNTTGSGTGLGTATLTGAMRYSIVPA